MAQEESAKCDRPPLGLALDDTNEEDNSPTHYHSLDISGTTNMAIGSSALGRNTADGGLYNSTVSKYPQNEMRHKELLFPDILLRMLGDSETHGFEEIISWTPEGDGATFKIHNIRHFESMILPKYFKMTKYKSFTRQLHNYGFIWVRNGPNKGGYYNPDFPKWKKSHLGKLLDRRGVSVPSTQACAGVHVALLSPVIASASRSDGRLPGLAAPTGNLAARDVLENPCVGKSCFLQRSHSKEGTADGRTRPQSTKDERILISDGGHVSAEAKALVALPAFLPIPKTSGKEPIVLEPRTIEEMVRHPSEVLWAGEHNEKLSGRGGHWHKVLSWAELFEDSKHEGTGSSVGRRLVQNKECQTSNGRQQLFASSSKARLDF